jgi:hypothetical protein
METLNPDFVVWCLLLARDLALATLSVTINWQLFDVMRRLGAEKEESTMTHFQRVKAFLKEYRAATVPFADKPGWREWRGEVALEVTGYYGHAYLRHIQAREMGRGAGTAALRWLLRLARAHAVAVIGHAGKFLGRKAPGPGVTQLRRWYRKHGARFDRHGAFVFWPSEEVEE